MTGAATEPVPPPEDAEERPFLPRWVLYVMVPGVVGPVLIFGFILVTESAHDLGRCPYAQASQKSLGEGIRVVEETRSCIEDVEERRYVLYRAGPGAAQAEREQPHMRVLGRRRLARVAFGRGFRWTAKLTQGGEVQVEVFNEGHGSVLFREGTVEEREKGVSY